MNEYFPGPKFSGGRVKVELDLSNYGTGVTTSKFAKKADLANLNSDVDKLDIDKLKNVPRNLNNFKIKVYRLGVDKLVPVPVHLSKLNDIVKMMFGKMYIMLKSKIFKIKYLILLT